MVSKPTGNYIVASTGGIAALTYGATKADADLIAAAPELLAALEEMTATFGWQAPNANPAVDASVAAALAAIAKAKGE